MTTEQIRKTDTAEFKAEALKLAARWVFQCFQGITIIYINEETQFVANLEERHRTIINCLGHHYQIIYSKSGAEDRLYGVLAFNNAKIS